MIIYLTLIFSLIYGVTATQVNSNNWKVSFLEADESIKILPSRHSLGFLVNDFHIFCYRGNVKTLARIFETIDLQLEIENDDYTQYQGETPEIVHTHHENHKSIFSVTLFSQKKTRITLSSFNQQCIGIETSQPYRVYVRLLRIDFWRVMQMALGICVFLFASQLSQNPIFYYIVGVLLGICCSFMLLIYMIGKLVPKRPMMYGALVGGWAIGFYVLQILWENLQLIVITYRSYVFWYIASTGFISFVVCYRYGPPQNKRSKDLIKWGLQLISLFSVYFASQFEEVCVAVIILTVILHYLPKSWLLKLQGYYTQRFPPKRRLLTTEEYYEQGVKETAKALDSLREYCSSPECKQWQTIRKLKQPIRFAEFVDGASHIKDDEMLLFESSKYGNSETEDDSSEEEAISSTRDLPIHSNHSNNVNGLDDISEDEDEIIREYYRDTQWSAGINHNKFREKLSSVHRQTPSNISRN